MKKKPSEGTRKKAPKLKLDIIDNQSCQVETSGIGGLARELWLSESRCNGVVSLILVDDEQLIALNRRYLGRDSKTDVIAFPLSDATDEEIEGEIYISIDRVVENACYYRVSAENELARNVAHGLLHLLGFTDASKEEKDKMTGREDFYLGKNGFAVQRIKGRE